MSEGRLFYVVGASEAGKDGLIDCARTHLQEHHRLVFAHRYVTRPAHDDGRNQVILSDAEFFLRKRHGLFVMDWESHGLRHGIGTEINYWLAMALSVVVNGSRGYLDQALKRYPDMTVVWISAVPEPIAASAGGDWRETRREGTEPFARSLTASDRAGCRVVRVSNDGSRETGADNFLAALRHHHQ